MTSIPVWDTDLSVQDVKRLSPGDKGHRTITSLTRKVELVERWAREGIPPHMVDSIPWDRAKLRRWADTSLRLWAWVDPQVDAKDGRNASLMERFRCGLSVLEVRSKDRGANLKREVEAKDVIIANLERQNAELLDQIRQLQKSVGVQPVTRR